MPGDVELWTISQLSATVQIPQLQIREAKISGIKADLNVANHRADVAINSEIAQSFVEARGSVDLTGEHYMHAALDTKGMPIEGLLALYAPAKSNGPRGVLEVHASAQGPVGDKARMQAQVVIPTLKADYQGLQIGNTRAIRIRYANSIVSLDPTEIAGTDTTYDSKGSFLSRVRLLSPCRQLVRSICSCCAFSSLIFRVQGNCCWTSAEPGRPHPALQGQIRLTEHFHDDP